MRSKDHAMAEIRKRHVQNKYAMAIIFLHTANCMAAWAWAAAYSKSMVVQKCEHGNMHVPVALMPRLLKNCLRMGEEQGAGEGSRNAGAGYNQGI